MPWFWQQQQQQAERADGPDAHRSPNRDNVQDDAVRKDAAATAATSNTSTLPHSLPPSLARPRSWDKSLNSTDWSHYTTPEVIVPSLLLTATTLALVRVYKTYLRRIPTVDYLKPGLWRRRSVYGYVTRVGDGDNFHIVHTPGGKWMGWGWLPGRKVQEWSAKEVKEKRTVHVRIAGVDAPECAHFGRPSQPYSQEALDWLRSFILHKYVRAWPYRKDQYDRAVSMVYRRRFLVFKSDVGLSMLKAGFATVYEAKFGSEFGNKEREYREAEEKAKEKKIGMWSEPGLVDKIFGRKTATFESPRQYKTRMAQQEKNATMAK